MGWHVSISFQVDAVCIDNSDVNEMPEQPKPPLPRLPADGVVRLHLVIPAYSTHVAVVPCENWRSIDLLDNTIFLPLPPYSDVVFCRVDVGKKVYVLLILPHSNNIVALTPELGVTPFHCL